MLPTLGRLAAVTVPSLVLALAGLLAHPSHLDAGTAHRWAILHILLLPVFPLVAAGFLVPLRGAPRSVAAVVARSAAFAYACFYTGLDAVAGIAAGTLVHHSPQPVDRGLLVDPLYDVGNRLGRIGAIAFIVAAVATCAALWGRHGVRVAPGGVVLLVAGWSFLDSHIFWPRGVFTMLGFAVGFTLLLWAASGAADAPVDDVRIDPHTGSRTALRPLFELAEDSADQLDSYLDEGRILVARSGNDIIGHLQLVGTDRPDTVEIKNMAVLEAHQGRGVGARLVRAAIEVATTEAVSTIQVATAAADIGNLRFYQRQGFRLRSVERDAFNSATGYPADVVIDGIPLRDRIWFDRALNPPIAGPPIAGPPGESRHGG